MVLLNSTLSDFKNEALKAREDYARQLEDSKRLRSSNR